jgi:hypothetical protein
MTSSFDGPVAVGGGFMRNISSRSFFSLGCLFSLLFAFAQIAMAQQGGGPGGSAPGTSMAANSPFSDYTASAVIYVLLVAFLVVALLGGAMLVINLGLMSKRRSDEVGGRDATEPAFLKRVLHPDESEVNSVLPADEADEEGFLSGAMPNHLKPVRDTRGAPGGTSEEQSITSLGYSLKELEARREDRRLDEEKPKKDRAA